MEDAGALQLHQHTSLLQFEWFLLLTCIVCRRQILLSHNVLFLTPNGPCDSNIYVFIFVFVIAIVLSAPFVS